MRGWIPTAAFVGLGLTVSPVQAAPGDEALARARQLYNERRFEAAVLAAEEGHVAGKDDAVDLIVARAFLERYRESQSVEDLTTARERLRRITPDKLNDLEHLEYMVGLAEALYLDGHAGSAAQMFETILDSSPLLSASARERVLDWWASALDHEARPRPDLERQAVYNRIRERMRVELAANPGSTAASYWSSAAASVQGDHQAAWDAALAGWVRAALASDGGAALREDLDLLVQKMVVPQRARALAQSPEGLLADWDGFKVKWAR